MDDYSQELWNLVMFESPGHYKKYGHSSACLSSTGRFVPLILRGKDHGAVMARVKRGWFIRHRV